MRGTDIILKMHALCMHRNDQHFGATFVAPPQKSGGRRSAPI